MVICDRKSNAVAIYEIKPSKEVVPEQTRHLQDNEKCELIENEKTIKELRENLGMNRQQFCDYFSIPHDLLVEWEQAKGHTPEYVLRLLEYYVRAEKK